MATHTKDNGLITNVMDSELVLKRGENHTKVISSLIRNMVKEKRNNQMWNMKEFLKMIY